MRQLLLVTQKGFRWPDLPEFLADDRPFHLSLTDVDQLEHRLHNGSDSYEAIFVDGALDENQSVHVVRAIRRVTSDIPLMWVSAADEFPASVCHTLEDYQFRMQLLLENLAEGFWEWSLDSGEVTFSARWQAMLGYREQDLAPTFSSWIDLIHPDDLGRFLVIWIDYMEGCIERFHVEYRMKTRDGHYLWVESRGSSIRGENGQPLRLAGSHNDISLRKRVELQLKHSKEELELAVKERTRELQNANELLLRLSRVDPLTNLANRRCLDEIIERERARGRRQAGSLTMSLIVVDIDFFKAFNDAYGHLEGDQILVAVADVIKSVLARSQDMAARFGGEEFVIVLPDTDLAGAALIASRVRERIAAIDGLPVNPRTREHLTVSMGVACARLSQSDYPDILFEWADQALYEAKNAGRNCIVVAEDGRGFSYAP